jgi:uncharacterized membrane protein YfcA
MTEVWQMMWLCLAAVAGGAINAVAGGGTLVTFPMLLWALGSGSEESVVANGTSTFALFPGSIASMWGYRREIDATRHWLPYLLPPSVVGGVLGAGLTLLSPSVFKQLVPWLILTASLLFLLQPAIARWTGIGQPHAAPSRSTVVGVVLLQFVIAVYGGYFGAGIGILMLSGLAMIGMADIHQMNGLKTVLATIINGLATAMFVGNGKVDWRFAVPMTVAAIIGGFLGASTARRLNRLVVRWIVISIGIGLSTYYFWKTYGTPPLIFWPFPRAEQGVL